VNSNTQLQDATSSVLDNGVTPPKPTRRSFSFETKMALLAEYERQDDSGGKGAWLRREGIYSSQIAEWRKQRDAHGLERGTPAKRGKQRDPNAAEIERLRVRNKRLEDELNKTRLALDLAGKAHALLEAFSESNALNSEGSTK
jgi:transposase-like protein